MWGSIMKNKRVKQGLWIFSIIASGICVIINFYLFTVSFDGLYILLGVSLQKIHQEFERGKAMTTIDKFLISFAAASIFVICLNVLLYVLIGRYVPTQHISVSSCRLLNDNVTFDIAVSEQSVLSNGQL